MTLIIGIGSDFLNNYYGKMSQNMMNLEELGVMLIFAVAFLILTSKIPPMLSGIITGGGFNSSGVSNYSGGQVMGAAATSLAVASRGMTKAVGALSSIASLLGGGSGGSVVALVCAHPHAHASCAVGDAGQSQGDRALAALS